MRNTTMQRYFTKCFILSSENLLIVISFTSHEFIKRFNVTFKVPFMDFHLSLVNLMKIGFLIWIRRYFFSLASSIRLSFPFFLSAKGKSEANLTVRTYYYIISWSIILQTYSIFLFWALHLLLFHAYFLLLFIFFFSCKENYTQYMYFLLLWWWHHFWCLKITIGHNILRWRIA